MGDMLVMFMKTGNYIFYMLLNEIVNLIEEV